MLCIVLCVFKASGRKICDHRRACFAGMGITNYVSIYLFASKSLLLSDQLIMSFTILLASEHLI
jgi:hypothetical protein